MDESIDKSISDNSLISDEVMNVSAFGDEELGIFWGKMTEREQQYVQEINYIDNKSTTDSCHELYDLQEVDEEDVINESNDSMALSQNVSEDAMNETFTIGDKTIGAEVTIDCDPNRNDEEVVEMPVWSDCDVSLMSVDQSMTQPFANIDINVCNQQQIHSYCNAINVNNNSIDNKSVQHLVDESVVNADPFSPTFLNTFKSGENIEKRNSSLGLINTERLMINSSPEVITSLDIDVVINEFKPDVCLMSTPFKPSLPAKLFENSKNDIEVNAKDLLSPFAVNQFTSGSPFQSQADEVPITCSLVDITLPQRFKNFNKNNNFNISREMSNKKNFNINDSTLDFILNEMACNSPLNTNQCVPNQQTFQTKSINIDQNEEKIHDHFHSDIDDNQKEENLQKQESIEKQEESIEEQEENLQKQEECIEKQESIEEQEANLEKQEESIEEQEESIEKQENAENEESIEKLKVNDVKHDEVFGKVDEIIIDNYKNDKKETPKTIKKEEKNVTLRSSKKKVTFLRSPLTDISRNIEQIEKKSSTGKYTKTNNSDMKKSSGIKPPQMIRHTTNDGKSVSAKKCIDFNEQTLVKESGIKPPQKATMRSPTRNTNMTPNAIKKIVDFDNVVSPVGNYIKHRPTPPIQRTLRPKTIPATSLRLLQPGFLSRMKTGTDSSEDMTNKGKLSQLPTLAYRSAGTPKLNKPSDNVKKVIPLVVKHIGGSASVKKRECLDASNLTNVTASTSFHETHIAKHTNSLKH